MSTNELTDKRNDPVVDLYVTTDISLQEIFQQVPKSVNPTAKALRRLDHCLAGQGLAREAIAAAEAVPLKGSDPELLVLMLAYWAELSCRMGRPAESDAIIHRARGLLSDQIHPEVQARLLLAESVLHDTRGNKTQRESLLREIVQRLPEHSPRRKFHLMELGQLLALQGRLRDYQAEVRELSWQCNAQLPTARLLFLQFINAVETGDLHEAARLVPQIAGAPLPRVTDPGATRVSFRDYQWLVKLMRGQSFTPYGGAPAPSDIPAWLGVVDSLLGKNKEEALRLARVEASRVLSSLFDAGFASFNLVRAELASGKGESARRLLDMRRTKGNTHYLDELFLARTEALAGNKGRAARHFADVLHACDHYQAKGRLDFELRLAGELSHGDILALTQSAERITRRPLRAPRTTPSEADKAAPPGGLDTLIGNSAAMAEIRSAIQRFADLDAPVLITGETGTGKDLVARALHDVSRRHAHPYTAVNCGSIAETLLESELFGHERGAFTGADKTTKGLFDATGEGTLFLDEIGEITPRLQTALLRVMETGEIRAVGSTATRKVVCRVIAATNADLTALTEQGRFRRDLLFRLQRLCLFIPPLRDRPRDVVSLTRHFVDLDRRIGVHAFLSDPLLEALQAYEWPGNVRELRNVIERMRLLHSDKLAYDLADLDLKFQAVAPRLAAAVTTAPSPVPPPGSRTGDSPAPTTRFVIRDPRDAGPQSDAGGLQPVTDADVQALLRGGRSPLRRLDRLRALFGTHGKLTRAEVVQILAISPNTATKDLQALVTEGLLERIEPTASTRTHYFKVRTP